MAAWGEGGIKENKVFSCTDADSPRVARMALPLWLQMALEDTLLHT